MANQLAAGLATLAPRVERTVTRARRSAVAARRALEFRKKVWFWLLVLLMALVIWFALNTGERMFNEWFDVEPAFAHAAGPPLAVFGMSLVAAAVCLINVFRGRPITIEVPTGLEPWLPTLIAIAVGVLIGTTIFV